MPAEAAIQRIFEELDPVACPGPDPGFDGVTVKGILITEKTMRFQMSSKETIP